MLENAMKKVKYLLKEKGVLSTIKWFVIRCYYRFMEVIIIYIGDLLPISLNQILFESDPDFSDNSKYLFEYLQTQNSNSKYSFIWLVDEPSKYENIKNVKFIKKSAPIYGVHSLKALVYAKQSEYIISTHLTNWVGKRKVDKK